MIGGAQCELFLPDLGEVPAPSRPSDTSRAAARAVTPKLGRLRAAALEAIRAAGERGLTADEVAEKLGIKVLTARPRCSELLKTFHLIVDSQARRPSSEGKPMTVWVAASCARRAQDRERKSP